MIKADQVSHELMEPGNAGYLAVREVFGNAFFKEDGKLDRQLMAARIFQDENARKTINEIIHPLVWKTIRDKISASNSALIVVEFAIMGEKTENDYDEMWYVRASEQNRIHRLAENRGYTKERTENIIASQASESEYLKRCDRVIENNGSIEELKSRLAEILKDRE
ncbi:MAG: dephospho-CoA kinase [Lacrimispora sp.]